MDYPQTGVHKNIAEVRQVIQINKAHVSAEACLHFKSSNRTVKCGHGIVMALGSCQIPCLQCYKATSTGI